MFSFIFAYGEGLVNDDSCGSGRLAAFEEVVVGGDLLLSAGFFGGANVFEFIEEFSECDDVFVVGIDFA